ncbi:MAG: 16S rRNA (guanine(966)-N(2))-methyltransferase RsmD [Muribaculaceae bacterium]
MRVISGSARGLKLKAPEGMNTRPTLDRIKESLFNIIAADMYDCRFLDLFSGSGAMGIECLSRGGQNAVFVDNNKESIDVIKQNINGAKVSDRAEVMSCDVTSAISKLAQRGKTLCYFMDHYKGLVELSLQAIVKNNILSKDGYIIAEQSTEEEIPEIAGLKVTRVKEYRITRMTFLTYADEYGG